MFVSLGTRKFRLTNIASDMNAKCIFHKEMFSDDIQGDELAQ
jgi:hypothetical protein